MDEEKLNSLLNEAYQSLQARDLDGAREACRAILEARSDDAAARDTLRRIMLEAIQLGERAQAEGDYERAQGHFKWAQDTVPQDGEPQRALDRFARIREMDDTLRSQMAEGDAALTEGRDADAWRIYTGALNLGGEHGLLKYHSALEEKRNLAHERRVVKDAAASALEAAHAASRRSEWGPVVETATAALSQLPGDEAFAVVRAELEDVRARAEAQLDAEARLIRAHDALERERFTDAIRLAQSIPPESANYDRAQLVLSLAEEALGFIEPGLARAREAAAAQRWDNAFVELVELREGFPKADAWRQLWLEVGLAHGQQALAEARAANAERAWPAARRSLEIAEKAFARVLEEYPEHIGAATSARETADLRLIVTLSEQAEVEWQAARRDEAVALLDQAGGVVERAHAEGRDYAAVAALLSAMRQTVAAELARIKQDEHLVRDGQRHLADKELARAAEQFRQALTALLPTQRAAAEAGLNAAEAQQRDCEDALRRAAAAETPERAVEAVQAAYALWPTGPEVEASLLDTLNRAGEAALAAGRDVAALAFADRALAINPDDIRAQRIKAQPGVTAQVTHVIEAQQQALAVRLRAAETRAGDLKALLEPLDAAVAAAKPYPDLSRQVQALRRQIGDLERAWRVYDQAHQRVRKALAVGDWDKAVEREAEALAALVVPAATTQVEEALAAHQARLTGWRALAARLNDARETLAGVLATAQQAYDAIPQTGDATTPLAPLIRVQEELKELAEAAQTADGALPVVFGKFDEERHALYARVDAVRAAQNEPQPALALAGLDRSISVLGSDATLKHVRNDLRARAEQALPELLRQADDAMDSGEFDRAYTLLGQANAIRPDGTEIAPRLAELSHRRKLIEYLDQVNANYDAQIATAGGAYRADRALQEGIRVLVESRWGLSPALVQELQRLLEIAAENDGTGFTTTDGWAAAGEHMSALQALSFESWAARKVAAQAGRWMQFARDRQLRYEIDSGLSLNRRLQGYRAAKAFQRDHPDPRTPEGDEAVGREAKSRGELLEQLQSTAEKALTLAEQAIASGDYDGVVDRLRTMYSDDYRAVEQDFPDILRGETFEGLKKRKEELESQARELKELAEWAGPLLERAREGLSAGDLNGADALLSELGDLSRISRLARDKAILARLVREARIERAHKALQEGIVVAQADLRIGETSDALEAAAQRLGEVRQQTDWQFWSPEDEALYETTLKRLENAAAGLRGSAEEERIAEAAELARDYIAAEAAWQEALRTALDGSRKARLGARLRAVSSLADRQRARQEAIRAGEAAFNGKSYSIARQQFQTALGLGAAVDAQLKAARAGALLDQVKLELVPPVPAPAQDGSVAAAAGGRPATETRKDWESLAAGLSQVTALAATAEQAAAVDTTDATVEVVARATAVLAGIEEIRTEAQRLKSDVDRRLEREPRIQRKLSEASGYLAANNVRDARLAASEARELDPSHPDAIAMLERVDKTAQAKQQFEEARDHYTHGRIEQALATVMTILEQILPGYPPAETLKRTLVAGREADRALQAAETFAGCGDFKQARTKLQEAIAAGVDADRRRETEKHIDDCERLWEAEIWEPTWQAFLDGDNPRSLELAREALPRADTPDFRSKLERHISDIVARWVESDLAALSKRLQAAGDRHTELADIIASLDVLKKLDPPPSELLTRRITELLRDAWQIRLQNRRAAALKLADEGDFEAAEQQLQELKAETSRQGLGGLTFQIGKDLLRRQDERQRQLERQEQERQQSEAARDAASRSELLAEGTQRLGTPAGREDLVVAEVRAAAVLSMSRYANDGDAIRLMQEAQAAVLAYDAVAGALERANTLAAQRRWQEADLTLRRVPDAPLLKDQVDGLRAIVQRVRLAERQQARSEWEPALESYRIVIAARPDLEPALETDLTRCRTRFARQMGEQIQAALDAAPPDVARAQDLLTHADTLEWAGQELQDIVAPYRTLIASDENIAQAAAALEGEPAVLDVAQKALREARRLRPEGTDDGMLRQWERLAQAVAAWEEGQLDQAEQLLADLRPPVADTRGAHRLKATLDTARAQSRALAELERNFASALHAVPPDYAAAAVVLTGLQRIASYDPRAARLREAAFAQMEQTLDGACAEDDYDDAEAVGRTLAPLLPTDSPRRMMIEGLPAERIRRLESAIAEAEAHLAVEQIELAATAADRAARLAGAQHAERITNLRERIIKRKSVLVGFDELIARANDAPLDDMALLAAMRSAVEQAPAYAPLMTSIRRLQERILSQARGAKRPSEYRKAITACEWAQQLGTRPDVQQLLIDLCARHTAALAEEQRRAHAALTRWDLRTAEAAITAGLAVEATDTELLYLQSGLTAMQTQAPEIAVQMRKAWQAWKRRDYDSGRQALTTVLDVAPAFGAARSWQDYGSALSNLDQTIKDDTENYQDHLARLDVALNAAARPLLHLKEHPTALLPEAATQHLQALWEIHELAKITREARSELQGWREAKTAGKPDVAYQHFERYHVQMEHLGTLFAQPSPAPSYFRADDTFAADLQTVGSPNVAERSASILPPALQSKTIPASASEPAALSTVQPESHSAPVSESLPASASEPVVVATAQPESNSASVSESLSAPASEPVVVSTAQPESSSAPVSESLSTLASEPVVVATAQPESSSAPVPESESGGAAADPPLIVFDSFMDGFTLPNYGEERAG